MTASLRLGFATASFGAAARWTVLDGPFAVALEDELSWQWANDGIFNQRFGLLTALALGSSVDLLLNGHAAVGLGHSWHMLGGAVGFDVRGLFDFGVRPMVEVSMVPRTNIMIVTAVIGLVYP